MAFIASLNPLAHKTAYPLSVASIATGAYALFSSTHYANAWGLPTLAPSLSCVSSAARNIVLGTMVFNIYRRGKRISVTSLSLCWPVVVIVDALIVGKY
jgi:hypothetical protein